MSAPDRLRKDAVVAVHGMLAAEHGGVGVRRDDGLLESALAPPAVRPAGGTANGLFRLAAAHAYGLARKRPFDGGNTCVAITAVAMFLRTNGYRFAPGRMDALETFLRLATGILEETELARWIEANARKI